MTRPTVALRVLDGEILRLGRPGGLRRSLGDERLDQRASSAGRSIGIS